MKLFQELMYKDPQRNAFLFQSYVQLTMLQLHTMKTELPYKVMERSVYSARCFIENMKRMKIISDVEFNVLLEWYDWSINNAHIETDLIGNLSLLIYIKCSCKNISWNFLEILRLLLKIFLKIFQTFSDFF